MSSIELKSRYPDVLTHIDLLKQEDDSLVGVTHSTGNYIRVTTSEDNSKIHAIDFEGGPMIAVGDILNNSRIKSIKATYLIEFEHDIPSK